MGGAKLALAILLSSRAALCQNAQLSGLIQDPSTATITGAEVTVRNEQTGGRRVTQSNESGVYGIPSLIPGFYRITVRAPGFETLLQEGVTLEVGENARLDFKLTIGDARTVVRVEGGAPLINTEDGSVGTVIDRKLIERMPLNGRGIQSLIELAPAVAVVPVSARNSGGQFTINGQRSDANYFTLDGVSVNFAARAISDVGLGNANFSGRLSAASLPALSQFGTFSNLVSPDALQEFRIQTSSFAPEFGRSPGGQIGLIHGPAPTDSPDHCLNTFATKPPTQNEWFNNYNGLSKSALRFHDLGGSLGGHLDIPHLYRGFNRTFFFFSFEDVLLNSREEPSKPLCPPARYAKGLRQTWMPC